MATKNLFCVALLSSEVPEDLAKKCWLQVEGQLARLELTFGEVRKLYHEANYSEGEAGLENIHRINSRAYDFITNMIAKGAQLKALEDHETLLEIADCQLLLAIRFASREVQDRMSKLAPQIVRIYEAALQRRMEYIPKQVSESLADGETGMLLMTEKDRMRIQFPSDTNVILVRPPVLDEIQRWEREHPG